MTDATSEGHFGDEVADKLAKHIIGALPIPMFAVDDEHRVVLWNVPVSGSPGFQASS
jgi:hypothetical protein